MGLFGYIRDLLKKYFLAGLLVIVPLVVTFVVLRFLLSAIDGVLSPFLIKYLGYDIPGLGFVIMLVLIMITGILTHGVVGRQLIRFGERLLTALPLVRPVYTAAKQMLTTFSESKESAYKRVVIIPYPRPGVYSIAFAAKEVILDNQGADDNYVAVFVPSTPTPFTGYMVMVKKEEVLLTDMSVEEAVKVIVSGGVLAPERLSIRDAAGAREL